jgi:hypothetical protein
VGTFSRLGATKQQNERIETAFILTSNARFLSRLSKKSFQCRAPGKHPIFEAGISVQEVSA